MFWLKPLKAVVDFLLPPLCVNCDAAVGETQALCAACWGKMRFIAAPCCARCGMPFDFPVEEGTLCAGCFDIKSVGYDAARSALVYDEASRPMILRFKHADRLHPAQAFAQWMKRAGGSMVEGADLIVPVPLHRWRLFKRRGNQAAVLAQALGKLADKPVDVMLLRRIRATKPQGHFKVAEREKNVKGAFALAPKAKPRVEGLHILLVDDVMASGATVNACALALKDAGAARVDVLTLARPLK